MKFIKGIFVLLLILIVVLIVGRNLIFKVGIEKGVKAITGLPLSMDKFDVSLTKSYINIQGLKLYNPAGFPDKLMVDLPEIYVDYNLGAFMKKKVHLNEVRLNLKNFYVITNKEGKLNLDTLKALQKKAPEGEEPPKEEKEKGAPPEIQIDLLKLQIGQVVFKDYSKGDQPSVKEFKLGLNEEIRDIKDPNELVQAIVFQALFKTPIANLTNFDMSGLGNAVSGTLEGVAGTVTDVTTGTVHKAEDALKSTAEGVTEGVKDIIKLPFGNK